MGTRRNMVFGFTGYAMIMMVLVGIFSFFAGLVGMLENEIYREPPDYIFNLGVVGWGIVQMAIGALLVVAAVMMIFGVVWARAVGVAFATISAVINFLAIPYYPIWSILVLALDIGVIWALTMHGRDIIGDDD
jgi:hypothetical protein